MAIVLTDRAIQGKNSNHIQPIWLVEIDADRLGSSPVTLRWASRAITIGSLVYDGNVLVENDPISIRLGPLRERGGQAQPLEASIRVNNTENFQAELSEDYDLENDPCRIYQFFDGIDNADEDDRILITSGSHRPLRSNARDSNFLRC